MEALWVAGEYEEEERSSYTPLSFFHTKSTVYHPRPSPIREIRKFSKIDKYLAYVSTTYIPLSLFTTIVPDDAASMDIGNNSSVTLMSTVDHPRPIHNLNKSSESNITANKKQSFLCTKGSTIYHPPPIRKLNCIPLSESKANRNYIPDDLAFSILSKLPIKSLKRFGCVRKSWSVLFENSDFMTIYSNHFISRSHEDYHTFILSCHTDLPITREYLYHSEFHLLDNRVKFNLPPPFQQSGYDRSILSSRSVNGIFCLGQQHPINLQYVLWNPATDEFRVIPRSPAELSPQHPQNNLYFRHVFHGFGYDQVRHDFKVIQYVHFDYDIPNYSGPIEETYFEIYSLKNNSWRTIDMELVLSYWCYSQAFLGVEVYVDGACHWLVSDGDDPIEMIMLSFDLSDEVFLITPIGDAPNSRYSFQARLAVLNGSIAFISNYDNDIKFQISILGELGVSESWIKLYIYGPFSSIHWPPVGLGKKGYIFFRKKDNNLAYVDLSTQKIEEVGITYEEESYFRFGLYKESLLSIGGSSN